MGKYAEIADNFLGGEKSEPKSIHEGFLDSIGETYNKVKNIVSENVSQVLSGEPTDVQKYVASQVAIPAISGVYGATRFAGGVLARGEGFDTAMEEAGKTMQESSESLSGLFTPKSREVSEAISRPVEAGFKAINLPGEWVGDKVFELTGDKYSAALAQTYIQFETFKQASSHGYFAQKWQGAKALSQMTGISMKEMITTSPKKIAQRVLSGDYPNAPKPAIDLNKSRSDFGPEVSERTGSPIMDAENAYRDIPNSSFGDEWVSRERTPYTGDIPSAKFSQDVNAPAISHEAAVEVRGREVAGDIERGYLGEVISPKTEPTGFVSGPIGSLKQQHKAGSVSTKDVHGIADQKIAEAVKADDMYSQMAWEKLKRDINEPTVRILNSGRVVVDEGPVTKMTGGKVVTKGEPSKPLEDGLTSLGNTLKDLRERYPKGEGEDITAYWKRVQKAEDTRKGLIRKPTADAYSEEAKRLGIEYKGIQDAGSRGKVAIFQDEQTGSFVVKPGEKVSDVLNKKRREFGILGDESGVLNVGEIGDAIVSGARKAKESILEIVASAKNAPPHLQDLLLQSVGKKQWMLEDSTRFWNDIVKTAVPDQLDRQAMVLYVEFKNNGGMNKAWSYLPEIRAKNPKLAEKIRQVIDRADNLSPDVKKISDTIVRQHYDSVRQDAIKNDLFLNYREDYINRIFKQRGASETAPPIVGGKSLSAATPHQKQRVYENVLERMANGGSPYTLDIAQLGVVYDAAIAKAVMHSNLLGELEKQGYMVQGKDRPTGWRTVSQVPGYGNMHVHPDAYHIIRQYVTTNPLRDFKAYRNLMKVRAMSKQMILSLSPFHYWNLAKNFIESWTPQYGMRPLEAYKHGKDIWKNDPETVKAWVEANLMVDSDSSMEAYRNITRATIGAKSEAAWSKAWDKLKDKYEWSQHNLWRKFVPSLKITNAELELQLQLKKNPKLNVPDARRQIAEVINRKYGLLNWEGMGTTPIAKEILANFLLAPDWTVSNFMYAKSATKTGTIGGKMALRDWSLMVAEWQILTNALNYAAVGHSSWENPEGYKFKFAIPWRTDGQWGALKDESGRALYADIIAPGSLRDISRAMTTDPHKMTQLAVGKANPLWKGMAEAAFNRDYFGQEVIDPYATDAEKWGQLGGHVAKSFAPIPGSAVVNYATGRRIEAQFAGEITGLGMVSRGPSKKTFEDKLKHQIERNDVDGMNKTLQEAAEQGHIIRYKGVLKSVRNKEKYDERRKSNAPYRKLLDQLQ